VEASNANGMPVGLLPAYDTRPAVAGATDFSGVVAIPERSPGGPRGGG